MSPGSLSDSSGAKVEVSEGGQHTIGLSVMNPHSSGLIFFFKSDRADGQSITSVQIPVCPSGIVHVSFTRT